MCAHSRVSQVFFPFSFSSKLLNNEPFPFWHLKSWKYLETLLLKDGVFEKEKFFCYMVVDQSNLHLDSLVSVQYILFTVHDPMFLSLDESWYKNNVSTLKPVLVCTVGVR